MRLQVILAMSSLYRKKNKGEEELTKKKQIMGHFFVLLYFVRLTTDLEKTKYLCLSSQGMKKDKTAHSPNLYRD